LNQNLDRYDQRVNLIARILIGLTAALHLYIAWFEIFAWTTVGPDVFSTFDPALFDDTVELAANQGVYNVFLAVGLIWALTITEAQWRFRVSMVFLGFVAIAGIAASVTIEFSSGLPQLIPSVLALAATALAHQQSVRPAVTAALP